MHPITSALAATLALALAGCTGSGVNSVDVFAKQQGTIQLAVATADANVVSVDFEVNSQTIGQDTDGSDGWALEWDTTEAPAINGVNYIKAYGNAADGSRTLLLDNTLLIDNGGSAGTGSETDAESNTGADTGGDMGSDTDTELDPGTDTDDEFASDESEF